MTKPRTETHRDIAEIDTLTKKKNGQSKDNWYDPIIADYIKNSDNELTKLALKGGENVEALPDRREKTDTANYYIFQIGQDVEDTDGKRFSTDEWIYIDSITAKIYRYDIATENLTLWKKH